jgi:hypothetical protein
MLGKTKLIAGGVAQHDVPRESITFAVDVSPAWVASSLAE